MVLLSKVKINGTWTDRRMRYSSCSNEKKINDPGHIDSVAKYKIEKWKHKSKQEGRMRGVMQMKESEDKKTGAAEGVFHSEQQMKRMEAAKCAHTECVL